ncbi:MAG TPA: hypothetical protein VFE86_07305, partial [Ilumatobacteraceae bacterium]|nr:hypothetical protein [Ilumatobacteraceae bacterium]
SQIVQLYDQLMAIAPSPIVALNRAIAISETDGPATALVIVERLDLEGYHLFHAVRGDLLERLDRHDEAAAAYRHSLELATNDVERDHLRRRLADLTSR